MKQGGRQEEREWEKAIQNALLLLCEAEMRKKMLSYSELF